jgi:hypothetical protein
MSYLKNHISSANSLADIVPFEEVYCASAPKLSARSAQGAPIALVNQGAVGSMRTPY